jgi:hypothetical protein
MDLQKSILFKYNNSTMYIRPVQAAIMIRRARQTCRTKPLIDCLCDYNQVLDLTGEFSKAFGDPDIRDPDVFLEKVTQQLHSARKDIV